MFDLFIQVLLWFAAAVCATYVLGVSRRRWAHIVVAGATFGLLGYAVYLVEQLAKPLPLEPLAKWVHLGFVTATLLCWLLVVISGVALFRRKIGHRPHRLVVNSFMLLLLPTIITGAWLLYSGYQRFDPFP